MKSLLKKNFYSLYLAHRQILSFFKRKLYGLRFVSSSFYMDGKSKISKDFEIGKNSYMGPNCEIGPKVKAGDYVMFGPSVKVIGADHRYDLPGIPMIFSGRPDLKPTIIESDVWIGHSSIIMAGTHIGRGSIVAAGSIVTHDVSAYSIVAGIPAKKINSRFDKEEDILIHEQMLEQKCIVGKYCQAKQ